MLILRKQIGSCAVSLLDRVVVTLLPAVPRRVVEKLSARYIAGSTLDDARRVVAALNADSKLATVDVLGEEVSDETEAAAIAAEYVAALEAFERDDLDANVSIKPTGLGLKLGYELCKRNVEAVIAAAEPTNRFVRIDMEDSSTTDETLRLFRELRDEGHGRVGPVLQASLKRTVADAATLAGESVRLCKGIYVEPESIQFRDDQDVRVSFVQTLETLLDGDCYAAIATHDEWLVDQALAPAARTGRPARSLRVPAAAGGEARAGRSNRRGRPSAPHLRALRPSVVRVLTSAAAGEPEDRRLRGRRSWTFAVSETVVALRSRRAGSDVILFDHGRLSAARAADAANRAAFDVAAALEPAPARPEDEREDEAQQADDQEDDTDGGDVDALGFRRDRPRQDCADGDQEDAD